MGLPQLVLGLNIPLDCGGSRRIVTADLGLSGADSETENAEFS